jgi:hypothetical protein
MPTSAVLLADAGTLDRVQSGYIDRDVTVPFPDLAVTYPAGTPLTRVQRIALSIIHDSILERPVYFASMGGLMGEMALERWAVRQGVVARLWLRPLDGPSPEGVVQGSPEMGAEWYDVSRSMTLYEEIYDFRGLRDRAVWFDRATLNIPWHFYALALQLSDVAAITGESDERVDALSADAESFMITAQGGYRGIPGL